MKTPLQHLNALADERKAASNPHFPAKYLLKSKYSDHDANSLTAAVIACFELHGGYAVRINIQGQYNESLKRWTKSQTRKVTADVHGVLNGQHLSIEIKIGKDRLSNDQRQTAQEVEHAGGRYYVARNYADFWQWFTALQEPECLILTKPQTTALLGVLVSAITQFKQKVEEGCPAFGLINYDRDLHNAEQLLGLVSSIIL